MGCGGGYRNLFRTIDYHSHSHNNYRRDDTEEKITILKKMYAEGLIDDVEYQNYKSRIYDRITSFDELVSLRSERMRNNNENDNRYKNTVSNKIDNKYKTKLKKLKESKEKINSIQEKLENNIDKLTKEKEKMQEIAEEMINKSEESAEKYIDKRIDIEEDIKSLKRRQKELNKQSEKINSIMNDFKSKELELEALNLQDEVSKLTRDFEQK